MKINESDFEYKGYRCVTTFTDMGHRCGYVGIPEGHPLYGKYNDSQVKVTMKELIEGEEMNQIGNRGIWTLLGLPDDEDDQVRLGSYFMVHGIATPVGDNLLPTETPLVKPGQVLLINRAKFEDHYKEII